MFAKKLFVATLISTLLAGCGGNNNYQAPLPDGTYDEAVVTPADDYGADTGATDPSTGSGDYGTDPAPAVSPNAGFSLKGAVADQNGKALEGASVSIGSQTVLTDTTGQYEITGISDTKVFVTITKTGYDPLSQQTISFTAEMPSVSKDFKLAAKDSDSDSEAAPSAGFHHEMTFSSKNFKSVSAMVVADNKVYVLGILDGTIFDNAAVTAFSADNGEEVNTFRKTGWLTSLPKTATSLKVDDDQIVVSNGETSYTFGLGGEFVAKGSGASYSLIKIAEDDDRNIKYELLSSNNVKVTYKSKSTTHKLENVGTAKAIGLDDEGHLLVLDSTDKVVQQYSYELP